jgi:anaerobic selenocysteine-containing dehydrogenase
MSSAVTGYKRAFGADVVPCSYEDVENSGDLAGGGASGIDRHDLQPGIVPLRLRQTLVQHRIAGKRRRAVRGVA